MTLAELIASARSVTCDAVATYLWSDAEWTEYANDAEREACRRARLIVDSSSSVCRITLDASHTTFALDPSILFIKRAKLSGEMQTLRRASFKDLDRGVPGWEDWYDEETGEDDPAAWLEAANAEIRGGEAVPLD